jgi:hypothetical protein
MNINRLQVDVKLDEIQFVKIPDANYNLMKKVFRITRPKPTNKVDLFKLYVSMIKNISCNEIIVPKQIRIGNNKRQMTYKLNDEIITFHIELNICSNQYLRNYDDGVLSSLKIIKPLRPVKLFEKYDDDPFMDDEDVVIKRHRLDDDLIDD